MILRHSRHSLLIPCCNIHSTACNLNPRDPKKQWEDFSKNVKQRGFWWKSQIDEKLKQEKQKFERKQSSDQHQGEQKQNGDKKGSKSFADQIPDNFITKFPTPAKFNSYFDRVLSKLPAGDEIVRRAPPKLQPYLKLSRVDKPIGTWLLYLPCAWGIGLAAPMFHLPDAPLLVLFGVGAILMRGAGCTVNDMYDIDIDRRVIRTRNRPLASGALQKKDALLWLGAQLGLSSLILFTLNSQTIVLGLLALSFVGTYPIMKRITSYPQFHLGITINMGVLMGYSAAAGHLAFAPFALYSAAICWTMIYDTIYAHQDKKDDKAIGVKSTALTYGEDTLKVCSNFTTAMGMSLFLAGLATGMGPSFFATTFMASCMILRGLSVVDLDKPQSCWEFFVMNRNIGLLIFIGVLTGHFI